jgi:hypothetical protein
MENQVSQVLLQTRTVVLLYLEQDKSQPAAVLVVA